MQRIFSFLQQARQRINARIAILVVTTLLGGTATWQGYRHMAASSPAKVAKKKQVATGVSKTGAAAQMIQPAMATLTDDQLPGGTGSYQHTAYGDSETPMPPVNPYVQNPASEAGLYPAKPYAPPTAVPSSTDTSAAPENPYRTSLTDGSGAYAPPTSPYAAASPPAAAAGDASDAQPGAANTYGIGTNGANAYGASAYGASGPAEDPSAAYAGRFSRDGAATNAQSSETATSESTAIESSAAIQSAPPSSLAGSAPIKPLTSGSSAPPADLSTSPYGAASAPATLDASATAQPLSSAPGGLSPYVASEAASLRQPRRNSLPDAASLSATSSSAALSDNASRAAPTPGERLFEGPQQPTITVEKFSPSEIQVGKPAAFEMVVRNAGQAPAQNVVITDHVPAGTQLVDVKPQPTRDSDGLLVWQLGTMQPGEEVVINLQVMPQTEGEIGSTAQVTFTAQATSRSICTRPQLTIEHTAPAKVLIGESLAMSITVSNPGTGPATGVAIEEDVPEGLSHVAGPQLEYEVGTLRPGESKRLELALKADKAGVIENTIVVRGEGNLAATHKVQIEVIAPQLEVEVTGPKKRFLERQATYTVAIANPGTAAARDVELVAYLPRGLKFVETDSQGQYDPAQHAVFWSLEELPPSKAGSVNLTALPIEPGEQRLRIEGRADLGLTVTGEQIVQVEQSAELLHTVKDADDVIEVGSETSYEIRVTNVGTKAATNIRIAALLPPELKGLAGEGPTRATGDASRITFEPLARLNPQEEVVFKVQAQGVGPGDHIIRVQLASDEWPTPVTREESTRVYEDR